MSSTIGGVDRELLELFRARRRVALARAITLVENARPGSEAFLHELRGEIGAAHRIGLTGPPGAGKSTLTTQLAARYRDRDEMVGIVAVDPTSPFSGGALLGDRIRMNSISTDPGIFIRSMATRGSLGGLAMASKEVADLLDAYGFSRVITETVGVGQSELDIADAADTTVVVLVPESGDSIQAMKAGLMEIADIFVINKADRPGADKLAQELEVMLHMRLGEGAPAEAGHHGLSLRTVTRAAKQRAADVAAAQGGWAIPVLKTVGQKGEGVDELLATIDQHRVYLEESGELSRRRRSRAVERVRAAVERELKRRVWETGSGALLLEESLPALESGDESPYSIGARIVRAFRAANSEEQG
jgi:LAO/AO transport system kinase